MRRPRRVSIAAFVLTLGSLATGAEKGTNAQETFKDEQGAVHTVTASMDYPTNGGVGIQAEKRPGEFTIPKGSIGIKLKYQFVNPQSGRILTKLHGSNLYSMTQKCYMHELDENPDSALPPGDYKFVVGSMPGAIGMLTYTLARGATSAEPTSVSEEGIPEGDVPRNGRISLVLSVPDVPGIEFHWDFDMQGGVVVGRGKCVGVPTEPIQNYCAEYRFLGTRSGRKITGATSEAITWESPGAGNKTCYDGHGELNLTLHKDYTVAGWENHSGTTNGEPTVNGQKRVWVGAWQTSQQRAAEP